MYLVLVLYQELDQQIDIFGPFLINKRREKKEKSVYVGVDRYMHTPQLAHLHPSQPPEQEVEQALQEQGVILLFCFFSLF